MKDIRWGLVSTANINRRLIPAIRESMHGTVTAVASRSMEKASAYAKEWDIPLAFGSYGDMFDSGEVDAVYVSLPNHLHAEWSIKAMQSGLHVLCEKPLAITLTECKAMIQTSRETGQKLAEAFMYLHHPQTRLIIKWVREGKVGDVMIIKGAFHFPLPETRRHPGQLDIRLVPEYGGGSLWDVGVYPLSFAQAIMGETPEKVIGWRQNGPSGVDERFVGMLHYSGSRFAQISSAFQGPFQTRIDITGTDGQITLQHPFTNPEESPEMLYTPVGGETRVIPLPHKSLYLGQVQDMNQAILKDLPLHLSLEDSLGHIQTVLALYTSAEKGREISLSAV